MLISIHDRTLKRVAFLDNDKPGTLHFFDDTWHRYLTEATSTFDFSVPKTGHAALAFLTDKNYVSFREDGVDYLFNIMTIEETEKKLTCSCENLNLELLNETDPARKADGAKTFLEYLSLCGIDPAGLSVGINEISDRSRTLSWDGSATKLARLLSIVSQFDAECEFVTSLNRDGTLNKITLNVYKEHDDTNQGVGTRRSDVTLFYGKGLTSIRRTIDKTGLYTAINPTGTGGLTIADLDKTVYDSDGTVLFRSAPGDTHILCPSMRDAYPSQLVDPTGDRYINLDWSYDTEDADTLYAKALAKLKDIYQPALTYEVEGRESLSIGDTVTLDDNKFMPTLIVEARVSEQVISFSDPTKNKNTYANVKALANKLSTSIQSRLSQLVSDATPYTAEILTDNGTVFKNSSGSTTLTARVLKGSQDVTDTLTIAWMKDGSTLSEGLSFTVKADDVQSKVIYRYEARNGDGDTVCFAETTIVDVSDGEQGEDAVVIYIHSSAGAAFKNDQIDTQLTVTLYRGGDTITDQAGLVSAFGSGAYLQWSVKKYGDSDFTTVSASDSHLSNDGFAYEVSSADVDTQVVFNVSLITADE